MGRLFSKGRPPSPILQDSDGCRQVQALPWELPHLGKEAAIIYYIYIFIISVSLFTDTYVVILDIVEYIYIYTYSIYMTSL